MHTHTNTSHSFVLLLDFIASFPTYLFTKNFRAIAHTWGGGGNRVNDMERNENYWSIFVITWGFRYRKRHRQGTVNLYFYSPTFIFIAVTHIQWIVMSQSRSANSATNKNNIYKFNMWPSVFKAKIIVFRTMCVFIRRHFLISFWILLQHFCCFWAKHEIISEIRIKAYKILL